MKFLALFLVAFSLFFSACSSKNSTPNSPQSVQTTQNSSLNDDFDSEFGAEYNEKEIFDPLSGYNRVMTSFNDVLYRYAFTPIFVVYDKVMPTPLQKGISNFFDNLMFPIRFVNNLLQFKIKGAAEELFAFLLNSTVGVGGLFEVSNSVFGIEKYDEDFGQTLGHWGVGSGFPIVLPVLGQSNLRDLVGFGGDFFANPLTYANQAFGYKFDEKYYPLAAKSWMMVNKGSKKPYEYRTLTKDAIDLYPFLRDAYEQRRNAQIKK